MKMRKVIKERQMGLRLNMTIRPIMEKTVCSYLRMDSHKSH